MTPVDLPVEERRRSQRPGIIREVLGDRRARFAIPILALFLALALWPSMFDGVGPAPCLLSDSLVRPNFLNPLGRDLQGCDLWALTVHGARNSLLVGVGAVAVATAVAVLLGSLATVSVWADRSIRMAVDLFMGIPIVLVALTVLTATETRGPFHVVAALSFFGWPLLTRVFRAEVLSVSNREYVEAARALGSSPARILRKHVVPNSLGPLLALASLTVAMMITTEAVVTFLGAGLQLPDTSWGILLEQAGRSFRRAPHTVLPGIVLVTATGALVLLSEAIRNARPPS